MPNSVGKSRLKMDNYVISTLRDRYYKVQKVRKHKNIAITKSVEISDYVAEYICLLEYKKIIPHKKIPVQRIASLAQFIMTCLGKAGFVFI